MIKKTPWYIAGLHFECVQCGRCCSGPGEGYIWVTKPEIEFIADFLKISVGQLRQEYLKRVGLRTTIIEHPGTKDCILLQDVAGQKKCMIYPVRPNQCRTWPFWSDNLTNPNAWNKAAQKCPGINQGRLYTCDEIEKIKRSKKWWQDAERTTSKVFEKVAEIYTWLDTQIRDNNELTGQCKACGKCCHFGGPVPDSDQGFDHRLFVTPPELMYLTENLGAENIKSMPTSQCPYNIDGKCTVYEYRFASCRIFYCNADVDFQSELSESVLEKLKSLCTEFQIPYRYTDLATALNTRNSGPKHRTSY